MRLARPKNRSSNDGIEGWRVEQTGGAFEAIIDNGSVIGQESIVTRMPSPITVEAASDALVLRMPALAMNDLLLRLPEVVAHIRTRSSGSSPSGQNHRRVSQMFL